jgi:hypothetical protein
MPVFRFLRYLSRHSLQVFAWSVAVSYVAYSFAGSWAALSPVWQTMLAIATVLSLAIPAWTHERWKRIIASKGAQQNTRVARAA